MTRREPINSDSGQREVDPALIGLAKILARAAVAREFAAARIKPDQDGSERRAKQERVKGMGRYAG